MNLTPYKNRAGTSGVVACEIGSDSIVVEFKNGARYLYNYRGSGRGNIDTMKRLATAGRGLSTFISRNAAVLNGKKLA